MFRVLCDSKNGCTVHSGCDSTEHTAYKDRLGIEFYLRKPKDLAIVMEDDSGEEVKIGDKFGIYRISLNRYKDREIPHRMLLVNNGNHDEANKPCRIETKSIDSKTPVDSEYLRLYYGFIKERLNGNQELPKLAAFGKSFNTNDIIKDLVDKGSEEEKGKKIDANLNFVYHLSEPDNTPFTSKENNTVLFNNKFEQSYYLQPVSGGYSTDAKLFGELPEDQLIQEHFLLELIESALTNVVIVDERVSEWAERDFAFKKKNRDMLGKMRVFVPDVNRENVKFDDLYAKINKLLHNDRKYEFFVIHQGILDKLKKEGDKDKELMVKAKDNFKWLVIDSGRGVPEDLDRYKDYNVRFVEISALQRLLENFDKHGLAQTLYSTRKPPENAKGDGIEQH